MRRSPVAALACVLLFSAQPARSGLAQEAPSTAGRQRRAADPLLQAGFHVTLTPRLDEVFPDTAEYQRAIDRFTELTGTMKGICDDFARAVQETLGLLGAAGPRPAGTCPQQVARPYARAQKLGQQYLRIGRELSRHHELVRDLDRMGDSAGLTPDYRRKVKTVLANYNALLTGYREMKVAFYDQLSDELRFAGCDPAQLLLQAGGALTDPSKDEPPPDEPPPAGEVLPAEAPPNRRVAAEAPGPPETRAGINFYVDNTRCQRAQRVFLDGQPLGQVSGASRGTFHSTVGPHELCLLSEPAGQSPGTKVAAVGGASLGGGSAHEGGHGEGRCGDPGTVRRSYFHEGWTIALRCE